MKITVEMVRSWKPYYSFADVVPEDWTGTALDVLNLPISAEDRLWVVLREAVLPKETLREFARWCALQVIDLWDAPDVVYEYLKTGDETLRDAARAAAWGIVRNDARDIAWAAAVDATWYVAGNTAFDAMRDAQIEKLKEMISK